MEIEPSQERSSVDGALAQWLATERPADRLNRVRDEMLADHRREAGGDTDGYPPMTMGDPHVIGFEKHVTDEQVSVFAHRAIDIRQPSRYVSTKSRYITPDVDNIGDPSRFYTGTSTHGTGKAMADHRNGKCSASTVASHLGDDGFGNIAAAGITFAANPTRPGTMFSVTPHVQWDGWGAVGVIPDEGIDGYVESILLLTVLPGGSGHGLRRPVEARWTHVQVSELPGRLPHADVQVPDPRRTAASRLDLVPPVCGPRRREPGRQRIRQRNDLMLGALHPDRGGPAVTSRARSHGQIAAFDAYIGRRDRNARRDRVGRVAS